jgi:hypothetical protein
VFLGMITPAGRVAYVAPPLPADVGRTCRWYAEQGRAACVACSHVVTDAR